MQQEKSNSRKTAKSIILKLLCCKTEQENRVKQANNILESTSDKSRQRRQRLTRIAQKQSSNRFSNLLSPIQEHTDSLFSFKSRVLEAGSSYSYKKQANRKRKVINSKSKFKVKSPGIDWCGWKNNNLSPSSSDFDSFSCMSKIEESNSFVAESPEK